MRTDIRDFILRDASIEDTNKIIELVKQRRARLSRMNTANMLTGDEVQFTSSRSGQVIKGTVEKISIKNVIVRTAFGKYRVPANMLTTVNT